MIYLDLTTKIMIIRYSHKTENIIWFPFFYEISKIKISQFFSPIQPKWIPSLQVSSYHQNGSIQQILLDNSSRMTQNHPSYIFTILATCDIEKNYVNMHYRVIFNFLTKVLIYGRNRNSISFHFIYSDLARTT